MIELLKNPVYEFYLRHFRLLSKTELAEKILFECGLDIKSEDAISEIVYGPESFSLALKIVLK